ncbi:MAG: hypothetical protein ABI598_03535 [Chloroflexota bacterium]
METDPLVRDYLGRLEAAAWMLPGDRRRELGEEVHEHIDAALAAAGRQDEVAVRNVLERLGRPEEIIAAEVGPGGPPNPTQAPDPADPARRSMGGVEIIALLLLTIGAIFLPLIGPLIGLVFVWSSSYWTRNQKLVATVIVAVLLLITIAGLAVGSGSAAQPQTTRSM